MWTMYDAYFLHICSKTKLKQTKQRVESQRKVSLGREMCLNNV